MTKRGAKIVGQTAKPGPSSKSNVMVGRRAVCLDVLRAWHFRQLGNRHWVQMLLPIHQ